MEQTTLKELRRLVRIGAAEKITKCKQITEGTTRIAYSSGIYGINGALLRGDKTNRIYAIIGRIPALFYYC